MIELVPLYEEEETPELFLLTIEDTERRQPSEGRKKSLTRN